MIFTLLVAVLNVAEPGDVLDLSTTSDSTALAEKVWASSPELLETRAKVAAARADAARARFLPNPSLDLSLNTIPIGPTNPTDLKDPLLNVPNVGVALSVLLEIGKRGPRQDAMQEAARSAALAGENLVAGPSEWSCDRAQLSDSLEECFAVSRCCLWPLKKRATPKPNQARRRPVQSTPLACKHARPLNCRHRDSRDVTDSAPKTQVSNRGSFRNWWEPRIVFGDPNPQRVVSTAALLSAGSPRPKVFRGRRSPEPCPHP